MQVRAALSLINQVLDEKLEGIGVRSSGESTGEEVGAGISSPPDTVEALRRVSVFADQPTEHLHWFVENAKEMRLQPGDILFRKGDAADNMVIYLEGEGHASREHRSAAFANDGVPESVRALIEKIAKHAYKVTDDDIAAAKAAGLTEDQIFELAVCTAMGQASRQYENALAALAEATGGK